MCVAPICKFYATALQKGNSGAWLWCSKDDKMLDAIRKAS